MIDRLRAAGSARMRRRVSAGCGLIAMTAVFVAAAGPATASTHDYCNWDGSYNYLVTYTACFQSGDNYLTDNHAYLPYLPVTPTIFCAANLSGTQYGSWVGGNPSCDHVYGGGNLLKAKETVDTTSTTHGDITY
jgi:hypothetical protein